MGDFDVTAELELLDDYLDREMESIKRSTHDYFVIKPDNSDDGGLTAGPHAEETLTSPFSSSFPYDCGDQSAPTRQEHLPDGLVHPLNGEAHPYTGNVCPDTVGAEPLQYTDAEFQYTGDGSQHTDDGSVQYIDDAYEYTGGNGSYKIAAKFLNRASKLSKALDIINPKTGEKVQL